MNCIACATAAAFVALAAPVISTDPDSDGGVAYWTSIAAPVIKIECENISPGFAEKFEQIFPDWQYRNLDYIKRSKKWWRDSLSNPGTDEEQEKSIRIGFLDSFQKDEPDGRKEYCAQVIKYFNSGDPKMDYYNSVVGPAVKPQCDALIDDYAKNFDAAFPAWQAKHKDNIAKTKEIYAGTLEPGQTPEQGEEAMRKEGVRMFATDTAKGRKASCELLLQDIATN